LQFFSLNKVECVLDARVSIGFTDNVTYVGPVNVIKLQVTVNVINFNRKCNK